MIKDLIQRLSSFLGNGLLILWNYRVITFSLLVMYAVLWHADQGIDLLANLNASYVGPPVLIVVISIMAALHWHLPKFIYKSDCGNPVTWKDVFFRTFDYKDHGTDKKIDYDQTSDIARMLGVFTFLIPASAILHALDHFEVDYWINFVSPHVWLLVSAIFYGLLFSSNFIDNRYKSSAGWRLVFHILLVLFPVLVMVFAIFNEGYPTDLGWVAVDLFLMAAAFAIFVSIRRHLGLSDIPKFKQWQKINVATYIMFPVMAVLFIFLMMNVYPLALATTKFNVFAQVSTLSVVLCGLVFYTLFFSWLIFWGRNIKVTLAGFFLLGSVIIASVYENDFHDVATVKKEAEKDSLETYVHNWITERQSEIMARSDEHPYPLFVVNAYGGGIRAAAWTSLAIHQLDSMERNDAKSTDFQHHVLAYSGASGGTIGASVMCALRSVESAPRVTRGQLKTFYNQDFLSPILVGMIGRDILSSTFHISYISDRAREQVAVWTHHLDKQFKAKYSQTLGAMWNGNRKVPLLFSNTYHIEKGFKGIMAPVQLNEGDFPSVTLVNSLLANDADLSLGTAAFLSARFPFISPAGKMGPAHHFMDGGLKENAGAGTASQVADVVERVIDNLADTAMRNKLKVYVVSLDNGLGIAKDESSAHNLFELMAPLKALYTNWGGNTEAAEEANEVKYKGRYFKIQLTKEKLEYNGTAYTPVYPLGWQLSEVALDAMEQSLDNESNIAVIGNIKMLIKQ